MSYTVGYNESACNYINQPKKCTNDHC